VVTSFYAVPFYARRKRIVSEAIDAVDEICCADDKSSADADQPHRSAYTRRALAHLPSLSTGENLANPGLTDKEGPSAVVIELVLHALIYFGSSLGESALEDGDVTTARALRRSKTASTRRSRSMPAE